jgi:hypothetical protein
MLEAEHQFRRIIGYRGLAKLSVAIEQDLDRRRQPITNRSHPDRGGRYARERLTITPGPPSRSSTTSGTSSGASTACGQGFSDGATAEC